MSSETLDINPGEAYFPALEQRNPVTIEVIVDSCGDQELNVMSALEQVMKYAAGGNCMDRRITPEQEKRIASWFGARYGSTA